MATVHELRREQIIATDMPSAWTFIRSPANLNRITPDNMEFSIVSDVPDVMRSGLMIEYAIRLPLLGRQRWLTEIKHVVEGRSFVDEQRVGPYRLWSHYHEIAPAERGVRFLDRVTYAMPFGPLGEIVHRFHVSGELRRIFDFREHAMREILEIGKA